MGMTNPLIDSLVSIIEQRPEDHPLREHLAELLIAEGRGTEAVSHLAVILAVDPHNERVAGLMRSALGVPEAPAPAAPAPSFEEVATALDEAAPVLEETATALDEAAPVLAPESPVADEAPAFFAAPVPSTPAVDEVVVPAVDESVASADEWTEEPVPYPQEASENQGAFDSAFTDESAPAEESIPSIVTTHSPGFPQATEEESADEEAAPAEVGEERDGPAAADDAEPENFDWSSAEKQVGGPAPAFVKVGATDGEVEIDDKPQGDAWDVETVTATLADVGGMQSVKDRLTMAFLAPLRNPEIRKLYGKSLNGGLLLYGPPGCGKTYIARALAGDGDVGRALDGDAGDGIAECVLTGRGRGGEEVALFAQRDLDLVARITVGDVGEDVEARAIREDHVGQTIAGDVAGYGSRRARVLVREAIRLANDVAVARLVDPGESQRVRISSAGAAFPVLGRRRRVRRFGTGRRTRRDGCERRARSAERERCHGDS